MEGIREKIFIRKKPIPVMLTNEICRWLGLEPEFVRIIAVDIESTEENFIYRVVYKEELIRPEISG